jgi:DNA-binding SARP family transcriptional activator/tetratricopeptide (TPR) repeat protein
LKWLAGSGIPEAGAPGGFEVRQEFLVLGDVRVDVDGRSIDVGHPRQWCVLAALLVDANRPVPLEQLISRVWSDAAPQRARSAMYTYLSRLRHSLDTAGVVVSRRRAGYLLAVDPDAVDLHRFNRLVGQARTADSDPAALGRWERALALWRGEAFANLDTPWLAAVRADLARQRWAARLDRNDVALRLGHHGRLLADLTAAADSHPLDERVAAQLMLALYRCGRQGDALVRYDLIRRLLADELGADPSPPLRDLHLRMLTSDPALQPATAGPAPTAGAGAGRRRPTQLPPDVWGFTGRAAELSRLDALLDAAPGRGGEADATTAVVISAVSGTAGVGKTSLAVHWAHRVRDAFPDGQLYVNLHGYDPQQPTPPAEALASLLNGMGVSEHDLPLDVDSRAAIYRTELSGRRMLVILDNAGTVEQVRPLLPGTATCLVVVTSRDSLAGLVAVDGARRLDLDLLPADDATALLRQLIGARVDGEPHAAVALAGLCARLPLALRIAAELAVSRPALGLSDLVAELTDQQRRLDLLDAGDPHASVRAVLSWSYRHLPAEAARAFRFLGLHPGADIDDRAVAALTGHDVPHTRQVLVALTRAHLIQPAGSRRYTMHDLLRAYAAERVRDDVESDRRAALTHLFDHYLVTAVAAADLLHPGHKDLLPDDFVPRGSLPSFADDVAARGWLDTERANLVAACAHCARHGWDRHAIGLAAVLSRYLETDGHYADALSVYGNARDAAHRLRERRAESLALRGLGSINWIRGRSAESVDHFLRSHALCRETNDPTGEAHALHGLGTVHLWMGRHREAGRYLRRALSLFREHGDPAEVAALNTLGSLYGRQGQFSRAHSHLHAALATCRRSGEQVEEMYVLHALAMLVAWHGPFDTAAEHIEQALALSRRLRHASGETMALTGLGIVYTRLGRLDEAGRCLQQALSRSRQMGFRSEELRATYNLGILYQRQGHLVPAADLLQRAVTRYRQFGELPGVADALHALGVVRTRDGEPELAATHHHDALGIFRRLNHPAGEALALNGLGEALHASGRTHQARHEHTAALAVATRIRDRYEQARAHAGLAGTYHADGDRAQAARHRDLAHNLYSRLRAPEAHTSYG